MSRLHCQTPNLLSQTQDFSYFEHTKFSHALFASRTYSIFTADTRIFFIKLAVIYSLSKTAVTPYQALRLLFSSSVILSQWLRKCRNFFQLVCLLDIFISPVFHPHHFQFFLSSCQKILLLYGIKTIQLSFFLIASYSNIHPFPSSFSLIFLTLRLRNG